MLSESEILDNQSFNEDYRKWLENKNWDEIYHSCHRGDWFDRLYQDLVKGTDFSFDLTKYLQRLKFLIDGNCVNTIRPLIKDSRSLDAIDAAIAYGSGQIDFKDLSKTVLPAKEAYESVPPVKYNNRDNTDYQVAYAAYSSGPNGAYAAYNTARAVFDSHLVYLNYSPELKATAIIAKKKNLLQTADIYRKYLPIQIWNSKPMFETLLKK